MGRELRRVPANWKHPRNGDGHYIPLHDGLNERTLRWDKGNEMWAKGMREDFKGGWAPVDPDMVGTPFEKWDGARPNPADYMPDWPTEQRTHFQMYETCTEGTPISPVMASEEELADWLFNNQASAFGGMTASREAWLATIKRGSAPAALFVGGTLISGVEATKGAA